jgi:hypothetical protein
MEPDSKLTSAKPHVTINMILPINWRSLLLFSCFGCLNIKDCLNLFTYRLNTLYDDPVSQVPGILFILQRT